LLFYHTILLFKNMKECARHEIHTLTDIPVIFHHDKAGPINHYIANWHENVELLFFTEGEGRMICGQEITPVRAGELGVIDSHMLHRIESDTTISYHCLIVDEGFCMQNGLFPSSLSFPRCIHSEVLVEKYNKVADAFAQSDPLRIPCLRIAVLDLMLELITHHGSRFDVPRCSSDSPIRTAVSLIRAHYREQLSLDRLATESGLSKYHFLREFKKATGMTPVAYINAVRVKKAERLLRAGGISVARTAEACGFQNHSYFSRVFFRLTGALPSEIAAVKHSRQS